MKFFSNVQEHGSYYMEWFKKQFVKVLVLQGLR